MAASSEALVFFGATGDLAAKSSVGELAETVRRVLRLAHLGERRS